MTETRAHRPIPLGLTMLIAVFSALVAIALSGGHQMTAHAATVHPQATITKSELALRMDMRRLWEEHVTWTRLAIISLTTDSPDTNATVARLLANQTDIGNATTKAMLHDHLRLTTDEVVARLKQDWTADVRAYDMIHRQALHMADMLSSGIIGQFPSRFR